MRIQKFLITVLVSFLFFTISTQDSQAQNLLSGWNNTSGTPYDAGWRVDEQVSVNWGTLNGANNRFRTGVGSPANNGTDPMLYIINQDTKFGYPIAPIEGKVYQLSGKAWRRNGGTGSISVNFYLADNLLADNPVSQTSLNVSGNNAVSTFSLRLATPEGFTNGYFLWDAHLNSGSWQDVGIWLLNMTEVGDAAFVTFNTDGGSQIASQYFLKDEYYIINKPAEPTKYGYSFKGWYSDAEFKNEFDFKTLVQRNTTVYVKWVNLKGELIGLIEKANELLSGGTSIGRSFLNPKISTAQAVVDNPSATIEEIADAFDVLTTVLATYQNASLLNLQINNTNLSGFSATVYNYTYNIAHDAAIPTISATATAADVATINITQANNLPGIATVEVIAGDGSNKIYTVNFRKNYMSGWDGNGMGITADKPDDFGWVCSNPVAWIDATESNDTYGYRYRDNLGVGRVLTHPVNNGVFSFPVTLSTGKIYKFSCSNTNMNGTVSTMFGINTSKDATGIMLKSQSKNAPKWTDTTTFDFIFTVKETGIHYVVWQTTNGSDRNIAWNFLVTEIGNALSVTFDTNGGSDVDVQYFAEGDPYLIEKPVEPTKEGHIFAGWYKDNTYTIPFNFGAAVSENTTVYARFVPEGSQTQVNVTYENEIVSLQDTKYMNITVRGKSELHILSTIPLVNSNINLASDDSWLFLEAVHPSKVVSDWLTYIKINGQAVNTDKDRIAIYGSGTVIIPDGKEIGKRALTVYSDENYQGESMQLEYDKYYRDAELGSFDNNIRSFKLKKGYACTFANNPNGTGHSRVFIANDEDIEVQTMPEGLEFASFVRVFRWDWVGKKGICNGGLAGITGSSWYNDWAAGGDTENLDFEYVPMRHNLGWDSFDVINSRKNVSHVLGYNEPDHTDQANCTPQQAIEQWPELFKSGLRLGSPAPDAIRKQWLVDFLALADKLNYRVDFVVGHMYWNSQSGVNLKNGIKSAVELYGNRPMWITELNNGANWTSEWWPDATGPQRDADLNIILDANGNETIINRPLSPNNAQKQLDWMKDILPALDESPYLERHSLYNWVQDARTVVLGDKLTPAGKYFAEFNSKPAFSKAMEYIHNWKIAPPLVITHLSSDSKSFELSWYDHNGETGLYYVLEKKKNTDSDFIAIKTIEARVDYQFGGTVKYVDTSITESAMYRVRAMSYKNTLSEYSDEVSFILDPALTTKPILSAEAVSISIINLSWSKIDDARLYTLYRSTDGANFDIILKNTTDLQYIDTQLAENTPYQYKVTAVNSWGDITSEILNLSTKSLAAPTSIEGIYAASGDKQATLTWNYQYDMQYRIYRADKADGDYLLVADNIDAIKYVDKTLINNQTYYYKVEAFNREGSYLETIVYHATPQDSRHAYYDFNENSGNVAHDKWGGYHGTLENNAIWETISPDVNVVSMTAASKAYVKLADGITSELNDFTVSMLINMSSKSSRIFSFGENTANFMVLMPNMRYKITCSTGTYDVTATGYTLPLNEWVHLTLTQQGTTFKMYHDGIEFFSDNNATVKPSDMGMNTNNFLVKSHFGSDGYSSCKFDEFRIYNRALSKQEIQGMIAGDPLYSIWLPQSGSTDWVSPSNWSDGVPRKTTKVTIPKSSSYPVLTEETEIENIYFDAGAELGRQDLLTYQKAFINYDYGKGERSSHFHMLSIPLMEAFPGDFTFGGQPDTYIQTFKVDETGRGKWMALSGGNSGALTAGTGFVLSLDSDKGLDKGLGLSRGILRLPFFDEDSKVADLVHPNHTYNEWISTFSNPYGSGSYNVPRSTNAYRLAGSNVVVNPNFGQSGGNILALVGNPFMSTIDFSQLQADNNTLIKDNYQIWTKVGSQEGYSGYSLEGNWGLVLTPDLDNLIAPLQGFVVEQADGGIGPINFNLTNISDENRGVLRKSAVIGNKIDIIARTEKSSVRTFVARREGGSVAFGNRDSRKLINNLTEVPEVYTLKSLKNDWVAVGANIFDAPDVEYRLGLATTFDGQITLSFTGMNNCDSKVIFADKVLNKTIELSGLSNYDYKFSYVPTIKGGEVKAAEDRFSLRMTSVVSGIEDELLGSRALNVYVDNKSIYAVSNEATISDFKVYSLSGSILYNKTMINDTSHKTTTAFNQGIYIVEVKTNKGIIRRKVIITNN